ncbi:MAG: hypothetical protein EOO81_11405 [Oxalobacteraceae bacterium]|nr:MAG: hypothetical protein EOO81_11405 [Oxalobacteraceae bacterium]
MTTEEMMAHAAGCMRRGEFEGGDIEAINNLLACGHGPRLVSKAVQPRDYDCANSVMTSLEALAEKNLASALNLMIDLIPIADELYAHDIYDSIHLWVCYNECADFVNYLNRRIGIEQDPERRNVLLRIKESYFAD